MIVFQGTGSSYSKASKIEFDRGAGYDDNDSFIDNTEAVSFFYQYIHFLLWIYFKSILF